MKENPMLIQSKNPKDKQTWPSLVNQFEKLSAVDQKDVLKLYHDNPTDPVSARLKEIFIANACDVTPANAIALYLTIPR